ncbi:hypothetical protein COCSUDRAFT_63833 [Coccomyxa subellipsoidea C-169]|uniref:Uncharacterized protein n=1 Tax=Coccomyxa subellipsoidea (strain C-169) TaxID=574566 RepID=I0YWC6_COCSC|nr:hypothetical protein COCSUDRAFT_63833 [Coccomyxa subellipsoidea C-169]EIE22695.1 hypothetical protein COCSUDRAFT_63833 [Coccomyxa subellipsoidea C-169]|eukprot:XP_005647239.1 hypothetical protein COCSUDRAFT_63833 [Coccomyxa subellipsoidea C-169]
MTDVLGVVTLGLSSSAATNIRWKEVLQELAEALAETIENDSAAMVEQVCQYHLGVARTEPPELPMQTHSASCSDEGRNGSGSGGAGPPSGGLPQLVVQEGGPGGSPPPGPDNADRADRSDRGGERPTKGKCAPADEAEATGINAAELAVPARPSAPVPPLAGTESGGSKGLAKDNSHKKAGSSGKSALLGSDGPTKWDQKLRVHHPVDTFDARKAGCSASAFEAAVYDPQEEKGAAKRAFAAARVRNFARTPTMAFMDEGLEAEYAHWQARQRWQLDAAGLLFLLLITATSIATSLPQSAEALQCLWLACLLHALPLAAMLVNLPWYLRKRERVLGAYMVCLAFHAVYLRNRVALQLGPQSALAALVWFSRVQAAEPLLFHAVMFAVRFRTALLVQAVCVVIAASNAAAVCSSCCSSFMGPTFCLLKALATQASTHCLYCLHDLHPYACRVVFGYGVPAGVLYFTEENFRQIFAEACLSEG